uniref:Uncharacterized protein n=1 Tax=Meloidogyne enterolobii TaxID=390850 RepID=A0A6V7VKS1_MELEN|nr:unnamed protein product [Meloidogyne enterolobii]
MNGNTIINKINKNASLLLLEDQLINELSGILRMLWSVFVKIKEERRWFGFN